MTFGLCSVTFKELTTEQIIKQCNESSLSCIEWGSDVHILPGDVATATKTFKLMQAADLSVSSYGTYYTLGKSKNIQADFGKYLDVAVSLHAPTMRVWAGDVDSKNATDEYFASIVAEAQEICDMAGNINVAFEYHNGSLCDCKESALRLVKAINRPNFGLYFQYTPFESLKQNIDTLKAFMPYLKMVHMFNVDDKFNRFSIGDEHGQKLWSAIIKTLIDCKYNGNALFEFLPNGRTLKDEAECIFDTTKRILKKRICDSIDASRDELVQINNTILDNPEAGYQEYNTSKIIRDYFDKLGVRYNYPLAITGVKGTLVGKVSDGKNVCVMGELDAVTCHEHKKANVNGVAHACGHNTQVATMLGVAKAFATSGVLDDLPGMITFMATPAEEFIDLEYRSKLLDEGKVKFFAGKEQLLAEGAFDDVDMAIMTHAEPDEPGKVVYTSGHNLGFKAKKVIFRGKAAHGANPYEGVNALNAAALAIIGIHTNRETFRDDEQIRIHPIITKGGDAVNVVPDEVCIEMYVRGANLKAIAKGNACVERSVNGAAAIVGANAEIEDAPGAYLPIIENPDLTAIYADNARQIGGLKVKQDYEIVGSSDVGELSYIMPVIQPSMGGYVGKLHSAEFGVVDIDTALITSAKVTACTVIDLLFNDCQGAKKVLNNFKPILTRKQYTEYMNGKYSLD